MRQRRGRADGQAGGEDAPTRGRADAQWFARAGHLCASARLCVCASAALAVASATSACERAGPDRVAQVAAAADSADQLMIGVRTRLTNQGVRQADLEADTAFVYENAGRTELRHIHVTFFSTAGLQQSELTADEGTYQFRSGAMEARGNVVVIRNDGARLSTSVLRYDQLNNKVATDQPYTTIDGERRFQGTGFVSDPSFTNITTQRVHGTGGGFRLPGQ